MTQEVLPVGEILGPAGPNGKQKIRLVIVDDHVLFRAGLRAILDQMQRYEVAGEAANSRDGLRLVGQKQPDVALVDISLPDNSGIALTRQIRSAYPAVPVLIVSMHATVDTVAEAFKAGATGYVTKEAPANQLLQAIDIVANGGVFLDSTLAAGVVRVFNAGPGGQSPALDVPYGRLTPREQQIMRMLAEGSTAKEIAAVLDLSVKTVENHRTNVMRKIGVNNLVDLIRYAARLGVVDLNQWNR